MRRTGFSFFILLLTFAFSACEKDDICVDGDTPLLVIRFYDIDNPTIFKPVPALRIVGAGQTTTVGTFSDRMALDSISIPLNPAVANTGFLFINDSKDDEDGFEAGDIDILDFSYEIRETYISRACGFIANYDNLNAALTPETENWIKNVTIEQTSVENPITTAHVKIFH